MFFFVLSNCASIMATASGSVSPFQAAGAAPGFSKYEKMESSTRHFQGPEIGRIKEWIVMEKIHGANLSLTVWDKGGDEGTGIKIARRNDYLKDGEQFFGLDKQVTLLQNLHRGASKLWDIMNNERTTPIPDSITIYGELFGGKKYCFLFALQTKPVSNCKQCSLCKE